MEGSTLLRKLIYHGSLPQGQDQVKPHCYRLKLHAEMMCVSITTRSMCPTKLSFIRDLALSCSPLKPELKAQDLAENSVPQILIKLLNSLE